jgi:glycine betaine/choline ABC-type transport system substrate-binding protein
VDGGIDEWSRAALEAIKIDAAAMRRMNYQVEVEHRAAADVAREFLQWR